MKILQTPTEISQACKLALESAYSMNPYWRAMPPDREQAKKRIEYLAHESAKYSMLVGYYYQGKLAAAMFIYPTSVYVKLDEPKGPKSKMFQLVAPYKKIAVDYMERSLLEKGEMHKALTGGWTVVSPDVQNKNIGSVIWYQALKMMAGRGWEIAFGTSTNPASLRLAYKFFGEVLAEVTVDVEPLKGQKFILTRLNLKYLLDNVDKTKLIKARL